MGKQIEGSQKTDFSDRVNAPPKNKRLVCLFRCVLHSK